MFFLNLNVIITENNELRNNLCCSGKVGKEVFKEIIENCGKQLATLIRETAAKLPEDEQYIFYTDCCMALDNALNDGVDQYMEN